MADHWPTERMIEEGHADYATPGDLEGLDPGILADISALCEVDTFSPDECIPCLAGVLLFEQQKEEKKSEVIEKLNHPESPGRVEEFTPHDHNPADFDDPALGWPPPQEKSVAEQFSEKVEELYRLAAQMLEGPPIPPKDVSLEELAALALGAKRWLAMLDSQGLHLTDDQEMVRQEIQRVVNKVTR